MFEEFQDQLIWLTPAAYLLVFGTLKLFSAKKEHLFFSLTSILVALALMVDGPNPRSEILMLAIWPSLYLFIRFHLRPSNWRWMYLMHFLPSVLWIFLSEYNTGLFFDSIYFAQHISYLLMSLFITFKAKRNGSIPWFLYGLVLLLVFRLVLPVLGITDYLNLFHLSLSFYLIGITYFFIHQPAESSINHIEQEGELNYEEELKRKLERALRSEKAYLSPDLTLQELALKLEMKSSKLSSFFNTTLGKNFNDVVNEYRVKEVQRLMKDPNTDKKATLMELAYQSGFNSKATFNRIFKQIAGVTPKEFRNSSN